MKICIKCGNGYPATSEFFYVRKDHKDGLSGNCKICHGKRTRAWQAKNREMRRQYGKNYRKENKEACLEYARKYRLKNKEARNQYRREYKKNNVGKINAATAKYKALKRNQACVLTQDEKQWIIDIYKRSYELGSDWQVDHKIPLSKGGLHYPDNLQIVLKSYNQQKNDKLDFRLPFVWEIK